MSLALAVLGAVATFLWWLSVFTSLESLGFYVNDKGAAATLALGPPLAAMLFLIGGWAETIMSMATHEHSSWRAFFLLAGFPTFVAFAVGFPKSVWAAVSILVIGIALWALYDLVERRFGT